MTINDLKRYLMQVEKLDAQIANKLIEKSQWKDLALSITANMDGERVSSSGSQSKMANAVTKCIDMESEVSAAVDRLIIQKKKIVILIEKVDNPMYYNLLHMIYIQHLSLQDVADRYSKQYSWATTMHGRALESLLMIMEGE